MKTDKIKNMPASTQEQIINTLSCFDYVYVSCINNSIYKVSTGMGLSDKYNNDNVSIAIIKNSDIYTPEEIENNIKNM